LYVQQSCDAVVLDIKKKDVIISAFKTEFLASSQKRIDINEGFS
jgi:hypothetical protein